MVLGRIEVDDHVHHVDVQAPGRDVGGHQGGKLSLAEVLQGPLPVGLAEVSVDGVRLYPFLAELLDQPVGSALGAHEDQRLLRVPADGGTHLDPVHLVHLEEAVLHRVDGRVRGGHLVQDRVGQVPADQPVHRAVQGGGEQQGLVFPLEATEHPLDLGHEAHVGHAVGLVQHEGLDVGHRELAPVTEVDQPARGGDDHVDAPPQLLHLALDVGAAVDGGDPQAGLLGQWLEHFADLHGQLAGGDQHQARGRPGSVDRAAMVRWRSGMPKASVLPEPVLALPHTSRPASASATVMAWMAKVVVIPWAARAFTREGSTPREAKVGGLSASTDSRSEESRTRSDGSAVVVMGMETHSRLFVDGRRPTVDRRATHVCLRARLGPSSGLRRQAGEQDEEDPGGRHGAVHASHSTRFCPLHQVSEGVGREPTPSTSPRGEPRHASRPECRWRASGRR